MRLRAEELAQLVGERRQRRRRDLHRVAGAAGRRLLARTDRVGIRKVETAVGAPALAPLAGAAGDRLGDDEHVANLEDEAPGGVVGSAATDPDVLPASLELAQPADRLSQIVVGPEDPD